MVVASVGPECSALAETSGRDDCVELLLLGIVYEMNTALRENLMTSNAY